MVLDELILSNFRSYKKQTFSFSPSVTLLIGDNTAGKTNIIESIYLLATGKSFRADSDREVVRWGEDLCRIHAKCSVPNDLWKLEILITNGMMSGQYAPHKKYLINGVARRMIDLVGNLRAVLFWPEHLELVTDSPSVRRKYLDSVLIQVDREYRRNLLSYERGLRQRNKLLDLISEGRAHRHQLLFWNQLLIKAGSYLTDKRAEFLNYINSYQIAGVIYQIQYDKSVISETRLEQYSEEEIAAKATLVGPHRDDFIFEMSDKKHISLSSYGSRGEQRLAILWLKLAEVSFVEDKTGERPMLLLDDIFSELDIRHRELVLDIITRQQTIITTAEEEVRNMLKRKGSRAMVLSIPPEKG
jgi:DNA replication and repair protein RecF